MSRTRHIGRRFKTEPNRPFLLYYHISGAAVIAIGSLIAYRSLPKILNSGLSDITNAWGISEMCCDMGTGFPRVVGERGREKGMASPLIEGGDRHELLFGGWVTHTGQHKLKDTHTLLRYNYGEDGEELKIIVFYRSF